MDRIYVLAAAIVLAGFLSGGVYSVTGTGNSGMIVNRFTGSAWSCFSDCRVLSARISN
ncbi:hypothetical protein ACQ1Z2_14315 [Enterococcus faecalis]|jgi:hypothetical protein|uniref:hypothetical protein n=1 Tax=Enterococcus faecalis TaxID=1351 RepID=UPI003D6C3E7C